MRSAIRADGFSSAQHRNTGTKGKTGLAGSGLPGLGKPAGGEIAPGCLYM
jgi:hypothetical protein